MAALVAEVVEHRWRNQDFHEVEREGWLRFAVEYDPLVVLEALYEHWTRAEKGFRPTPGEVRAVVKGWGLDPKPYFTLKRAVEKWAEGDRDEGFLVMVRRYGERAFAELELPVTPSQEKRWAEKCVEHRAFLLARKRMEERGAPAFTQAEVGATLSVGLMNALIAPKQDNEAQRADFTARLAGLAQQKRITTTQEKP